MKFNTGRTYYDSDTNDYRGYDTPDGIWLLKHKISESPITLINRRVSLTVDKFYPYAYDMGNYATLSAKVDTAKPMKSVRVEIQLYDHIDPSLAPPRTEKVLEEVNAYNIRLFRRLMGIPEEYSNEQFLERLDMYGDGKALRITGILKLRKIGERHLLDGDILSYKNPGKLFYLAKIEGAL